MRCIPRIACLLSVLLPACGHHSHSSATVQNPRLVSIEVEVYDYRYDASEVAEIRGHIGRIAAAASGGTLVVANNHYLGKAMALTLELIAAWKRAKVDVPDPLIRAQPGLRSIARAAQGELF